MPSKNAFRTSIWFPSQRELDDAHRKVDQRGYPSLSAYMRAHFKKLRDLDDE